MVGQFEIIFKKKKTNLLKTLPFIRADQNQMDQGNHNNTIKIGGLSEWEKVCQII